MGQICDTELRKNDNKLEEIRKSQDHYLVQQEFAKGLAQLRFSAQQKDRESLVFDKLQSIKEVEEAEDFDQGSMNPFSINLFIRTQKQPGLMSRKTIAHIGEKGGPAKQINTKEMELRALKKQQERMRRNKEIEEQFQALASGLFSGDVLQINPYNKDSEQSVIHTIQLLSEMADIESEHLERYGFAEIRAFLVNLGWDEKLAAMKIHNDLKWRNKTLPVNSDQLIKVLQNDSVLLQGSDKDLCPCLFIRPNFQKSKFSEPLSISDYQNFFVYLLDTILVLMRKLYRFTEKLCILFDFEQQSFRIDLLQLLEELFEDHYPGRLSKVFIVRINMETITEEIQEVFQGDFYQKNVLLMDDTFKLNLLRFFDPMQLRKEYGGQVAKYTMFNPNEDCDRIEEFLFNQFLIV